MLNEITSFKPFTRHLKFSQQILNPVVLCTTEYCTYCPDMSSNVFFICRGFHGVFYMMVADLKAKIISFAKLCHMLWLSTMG